MKPTAASMSHNPAASAEKRLRDYLHRRNLRMTPERLLVLEGVLSREGHFDAEELLRHLQQQNKSVSRATLYRTLDHLADAGLVVRHHFREGHAKFEHVHGRADHDHMVCDRCGRVIEFTNEKLATVRKSICREHGFRETRHVHQIFGVCSECLGSDRGRGRS